MGEYWNLFLDWLNQIGAQNTLRTAPSVEERYANSIRNSNDRYGWYNAESVQQNIPTSTLMNIQRPAKMYRYIPSEGDTVYTEYPDINKRFGYIKPRTASTKRRRGKEYDILKRRFNAAWKLAKDSNE